ncbi:hypothetical protein N8T08_004896 [Aspergillus melleus]|uniref:Uncharacterized protein n=1 Tax=Aspergillus melleus TaxID=138277 RepID=A0ACC3B3X0_9EURO|nr:hypothetical protein N8T08_004896 [Aspergillus melleus]
MQYHYQDERAGISPWAQTIFDSSPRDYYSVSDSGAMSRVSPHRPGAELAGATLMPDQSNYPSLFRPSAEIPPFAVSYRYWEDDTVLWAFDVQEIKRVIRYGLFQDENLPRRALQNRNAATIDSFLLSLLEPQEKAFILNLAHVQKVEEILRRCKVISPPCVSWSWFPTQKDRALGPNAIAQAIDAESHLQFTRISFEEMVRYSLGYRVQTVDWFFQQHTALYIHLLNYLHEFPDEVEKYIEVEKHLRTRSPFAHRALAQCLITMNRGASHDISLSTAPAFEFIAGSIQELIKEHPPSLTAVLKVLSVLAVRYQRVYIHARDMNWFQPFDINYTFFEDLTESISAVDFARTLTNADVRSFTVLTEQGLTDNDTAVANLVSKWDDLSTVVWECCTALPQLIGTIQECVQALFLIRNYHAFTAILKGLQKYSITDSTFTGTASSSGTVALNPVLPPDLLYLLDPAHNFLLYRQHFQGAPGIPFLLPHLQEYREIGLPAFQQLFQQMRTAIP